MKLHLLLIGNAFIYNKPLKEYIIRKVEEKCPFINSVTHFKEGENSLFLYLEERLESQDTLMIVTSKENFATVGKLIATVTGDNQVLQENMLVPSKSEVYVEDSYLLEYKHSLVNVVAMDAMKKMPEILLSQDKQYETVHVFEEEKESVKALLLSLSQMHDVHFEVIQMIQGWLRVEIQSNKYGNIENFIASAKQLLSQKLIHSKSIVAHIIETLEKKNKKISFAESCTGGLLSYYFTRNNGASMILDGSLVTYSNTLKDNWLGVELETLESYGAVSTPVVTQMSDGVMRVSDADYTISVSGIAGDGGGTKEKPVGTVYIGLRSETKHQEIHLELQGDRNYVQHQSVLFALKMLLLLDKDTFF